MIIKKNHWTGTSLVHSMYAESKHKYVCACVRVCLCSQTYDNTYILADLLPPTVAVLIKTSDTMLHKVSVVFHFTLIY